MHLILKDRFCEEKKAGLFLLKPVKSSLIHQIEKGESL